MHYITPSKEMNSFRGKASEKKFFFSEGMFDRWIFLQISGGTRIFPQFCVWQPKCPQNFLRKKCTELERERESIALSDARMLYVQTYGAFLQGRTGLQLTARSHLRTVSAGQALERWTLLGGIPQQLGWRQIQKWRAGKGGGPGPGPRNGGFRGPCGQAGGAGGGRNGCQLHDCWGEALSSRGNAPCPSQDSTLAQITGALLMF
jgi:hypothetical protein